MDAPSAVFFYRKDGASSVDKNLHIEGNISPIDFLGSWLKYTSDEYNYDSGDYEYIDENGYSWDQGDYVYNWDDSEYRREEEEERNLWDEEED